MESFKEKKTEFLEQAKKAAGKVLESLDLWESKVLEIEKRTGNPGHKGFMFGKKRRDEIRVEIGRIIEELGDEFSVDISEERVLKIEGGMKLKLHSIKSEISFAISCHDYEIKILNSAIEI